MTGHKTDAFLILRNVTKARLIEDGDVVGVFSLPLKAEELIEKIQYEFGDEIQVLEDGVQELPKCIYQSMSFKEINRLYELAMKELPNYMFIELDKLVEIFGSVEEVCAKSGLVHLIEGATYLDVNREIFKHCVFTNDRKFLWKHIDQDAFFRSIKEKYHVLESQQGFLLVDK